MKRFTAIRIVVLLLLLVAAIELCGFSAAIYRETNSWRIFAEAEEPITFARLARMTHEHYSYNGCINNLRQLDAAKQQWALEKNKSTNDIPNWKEVIPYLGRGGQGTRPWCPRGGVYRLGRLNEMPTCSIPGHKLE